MSDKSLADVCVCKLAQWPSCCPQTNPVRQAARAAARADFVAGNREQYQSGLANLEVCWNEYCTSQDLSNHKRVTGIFKAAYEAEAERLRVSKSSFKPRPAVLQGKPKGEWTEELDNE